MLDDLKQRLRQHEGVINHLYLDSLGLVTCGVGHMIDSPSRMAGVEMVCQDGTTATLDEKITEWNAVGILQPAHLPPFYEARTKLRMTPEFIEALLDSDVQGFAGLLARLIPGFDTFPGPAQEALLDMAFQLGAGGLVTKFPHLMSAVKARDWNACAENCHRAGIQEWRNTATADLFKQAANT